MRSLKSILGSSLIDQHTAMTGHQLSFRDIIRQFLEELKRRAESSAQRELSKVVLGRPVHFVDDHPAADQKAENELEDAARAAGFNLVSFQFEPIAAAFNHEQTIDKEQLVLVVDIGGGTSDFSIIRLSPDRKLKADRRDDVLAFEGVHIGGNDFDKCISLNKLMPQLGLGTLLKSGRPMPSSPYFNMSTWHTINLCYSRKTWAQVQDMLLQAADKEKLDRFASLIQKRLGHWLAHEVETAKTELSSTESWPLVLEHLDLEITLRRTDIEESIREPVTRIERTVDELLRTSGIRQGSIDAILFVGGSSGMPMIRRAISGLIPQASAVEGDLFGGIGLGLAIEASRRYR